MNMKKTFFGVISGALAGGMIASVMTLGIVGYTDKEIFRQEIPDFPYITGGAVNVSTETAKEELSVEEIAKRVGPSIVGVSCTIPVRSFYGTQNTESIGSGIIIGEDGSIVTNYHVIEGASSITVKLTSGSEYIATVVGGDEKTDIAVIKIKAKEELHVATIGNSDDLEVGEQAVAIGNPLANELFGTVTAGIISGVNRTMTVGQKDMNLIQTDAAISPGNSGGALINKYGEVIGINSIKLVDEAAEGLGFAIPMNEAVPIVQDLISYGYVKGRPMIGVGVYELTPEISYYNNLPVSSGLYVMSVTEGSGAEKAGIVRGDIILKFDATPVSSMTEMNKLRDKHKAGDKVSVTIIRDKTEKTLSLTLTEERNNQKS